PYLPFAVLMEAVLQPCGWLAAYMGTALTSPDDLCFRNLGGSATHHALVGREGSTLTTTVRVINVSSSGGMVIQHFDFAMRRGGQLVHEGNTPFGFFTREALSRQVGLREARLYQLGDSGAARARRFTFPAETPFPDPRFRMIQRIDTWVPNGGPSGLGF